ncbi:hypothetical protein [Myceligenerans halotolerans]
MTLTRRIRPFLAGSRRDLARVLTVMCLVLAVIGVQAVCSVHLDESGHGGGAHADAVVVVPDSGHHGEGRYDCHEGGPVTARSDRAPASSPDLAAAPECIEPWRAAAGTRDARQVPTGVAVAAAPSLHALGISRT